MLPSGVSRAPVANCFVPPEVVLPASEYSVRCGQWPRGRVSAGERLTLLGVTSEDSPSSASRAHPRCSYRRRRSHMRRALPEPLERLHLDGNQAVLDAVANVGENSNNKPTVQSKAQKH